MLTQSRLKEFLTYNPVTGLFTHKRTYGRALIGRTAGHVGLGGYWTMRIDNKLYLGHRLVWLYLRGWFPADQIDHINGDRSDNRLANLRESSQSQNMQNLAISRQNTSGVPGVCFSKKAGKWMAQISRGGKSQYLGLFLTPSEAGVAYAEAKARLHAFQPTVRTGH